MRLISPILVVLLAGVVLVVAGYIAFWAFFFSGCGGNEEAALRMRALPEKRLESLFHYSKELYGDGSYQMPMVFDPDRIPVPRELADLKPKGIQFFGDTLVVYISGCMDDKVALFVEGLDPEDGDPKVVLSPGERQGSEILWQE